MATATALQSVAPSFIAVEHADTDAVLHVSLIQIASEEMTWCGTVCAHELRVGSVSNAYSMVVADTFSSSFLRTAGATVHVYSKQAVAAPAEAPPARSSDVHKVCGCLCL